MHSSLSHNASLMYRKFGKNVSNTLQDIVLTMFSGRTDARTNKQDKNSMPPATLRSKGVTGRKDLPVMTTYPRFNFDQTRIHLHFSLTVAVGFGLQCSF